MNISRLLKSHENHFAVERALMVQKQIVARGITDARVLAAMRQVPREQFVPAQLQHMAYKDWPLPIGFGQTISQPFTVAFMAAELQLLGQERVLEVGTGSGYSAAVLASVAAEVHTIERIPALALQARGRLERLGFNNVRVYSTNGTLGLPESSPFDAILVTAGADELPKPYAKQLADGGRIVIPIGLQPTSQTLYRYTKRGTELEAEDLGRFAFVPLIGEHGWRSDTVS